MKTTGDKPVYRVRVLMYGEYMIFRPFDMPEKTNGDAPGEDDVVRELKVRVLG